MQPSVSEATRWIVLKFGGTSVSRRHRWDTIGRLAKARADANDAKSLGPDEAHRLAMSDDMCSSNSRWGGGKQRGGEEKK